jgi:hypothetical protein
VTELFLDFYEVEGASTAWCWKYGEWSSEEYASEFLARQALRAGKLVFSQLDEYDGYEAALLGAKINHDLSPPFDYWVVDSTWVFEPNICGQPIGGVTEMQIQNGQKVLNITQEQFDLMRDAFERQHDEAQEC